MSQSAVGGTPQTVFVMMPFAPEYDDVYAIVKDSVATVDESLKPIRLDEIRAAGSITDDMVAEIRQAALCLADVTDANPNVMWEVGFATALGKPVVAISQGSGKLPFDVKDVRTLSYNRASLAKTLREPLTEAVKATRSLPAGRRLCRCWLTPIPRSLASYVALRRACGPSHLPGEVTWCRGRPWFRCSEDRTTAPLGRHLAPHVPERSHMTPWATPCSYSASISDVTWYESG
jgi:hypothetical protein